MGQLLWIAVGGALGACLRFLVGRAIQVRFGGPFPAGTLVVNLVGCLAIGLFGAWLATQAEREEHRAFVLIGLLGAFTTFSTYGWETLALLQEGRLWLAGGNVLLSNVLGLVGVWLGYRLGQSLA